MFLIIRYDFCNMENHYDAAIERTFVGVATSHDLAYSLIEKYKAASIPYKAWSLENDLYPRFDIVEVPRLEEGLVEHDCASAKLGHLDVLKTLAPSYRTVLCLACGRIKIEDL